MLKIGTILNLGLLTLTLLSCRSADSGSDLQGRPNAGGVLKLEKTYDLLVEKDPRLMKGRDIKFLTHAFRDYSFSQFLVDELSTSSGSLACELLDLKTGEARSLILNVREENAAGTGFRVQAADIRCDAPVAP
jgi:hypothetical protein